MVDWTGNRKQLQLYIYRNITLNSARQYNYFITQGNYIGYMFRLLISHLQASSGLFLSFESQDAMHTLGSHRVYIHGIHKIKSFVTKGVAYVITLNNKAVVLTYTI